MNKMFFIAFLIGLVVGYTIGVSIIDMSPDVDATRRMSG
jgi:hypothetical protein|tara:strand:+ start:225 stop:341 length:117 start_codon:yes stop_codon:yes gene_type:complete